MQFLYNYLLNLKDYITFVITVKCKGLYYTRTYFQFTYLSIEIIAINANHLTFSHFIYRLITL